MFLTVTIAYPVNSALRKVLAPLPVRVTRDSSAPKGPKSPIQNLGQLIVVRAPRESTARKVRLANGETENETETE